MASTASTPNDVSWRDGKRYWWLASPGLPAFVLATLAAVATGASPLWVWGGAVLLYVVAPLADWLIGEDQNNAPESAVAGLEDDRWYRVIVALYIPLQYLVTALGAWMAVSLELPAVHLVGLLISVGIINGVGINTAHELGHKTNDLERWLAKITLAPVAYGHFYIEHNKGHHKRVATPEDPASSRMGENLYQFLPRTVIGSVRSAWEIEAERLKRNGQKVISAHNENLQAWSMTVVLFAGLSAWLGWLALPFLILQAAFGASLLEVVNYLEHYGLMRKKLADGRYERCQPKHSWNSNHIVTNLLLYQLQRHSDHHANPTRRYQALRHFEESPQLPSGYGAMILIAYFPPIWFALMDRKVAEHHRHDLSGASIHPGKREALMRKWHRPAVAAPVAKAPAPAAAVEAAPVAPVAAHCGSPAYGCPNCRYVYIESRGCPAEGWPAGTTWAELPNEWQCPQCAVREKPDFARIG
jgi:alkane 1-monooxygenase